MGSRLCAVNGEMEVDGDQADLQPDLYMYKEDGLPRRPCGPPRNDRYRRGVIPSGDSADLSDRQNQFRRRRNRESTGFPPWSEESVSLMFVVSV